MQTSNINKNGRSNDSVWQFLAEYSLSEFLSDPDKGDELTTGLLFQPFRELGVPPDWIGNIETALTGYAKQALAPFKQGMVELSGSIRVFCQKKMIVDANSAKTSRPDHIEQATENVPIIFKTGSIMNGGWGYFIVENSGGSASSSMRSHPVVDLYLYREGE